MFGLVRLRIDEIPWSFISREGAPATVMIVDSLLYVRSDTNIEFLDGRRIKNVRVKHLSYSCLQIRGLF